MPTKDPFDLLDWRKRLRELSGVNEEEWADPAMARLENALLGRASKSAAYWLAHVLEWSLRGLQKPTEASYDDVIDMTDDDPVDVKQTITDVVDAQHIGISRAERQSKLPDKGPWVEVPLKPEPTEAKPTLYPKQAEWIARQSAGSKMREWAEGMRADVRWQVVQAIREGIPADMLAERLQKRWDNYGQRFQMIAVTEMSMAYNDGVLSQLAGSYVVVPTIGDDKVCKQCHRLLEGKVFYVSDRAIDDPTPQQIEQIVWIGKSNIGRLQENWRPCVPLHPNCRHVYVKYRGGNPHSYKAKPNRGGQEE